MKNLVKSEQKGIGTSNNKRDISVFKELKSFSVYVNLFSRTKINGITRSVFKIIVEDNISHHKFLGYSLDKSRNSVDIFVNYVLSNLEMRGSLGKNFHLTNGKNLIDVEGSDAAKAKEKKHKVIKRDLSHKEILGTIYKELILNEGYSEINGYAETDNPILPPLFVDSLISDFEDTTRFTDFWRNYTIKDEDNEIFLDTLKDTEKAVEKYEDEFDFEKALKLYNRINSASRELKNSEKITARILIRKVKIYFHLEQYDKCRNIIESNIKKFEELKLKEELGEFYYYLGMISSYSNMTTDAEVNFNRSTKLLMKSDDPEKMFIYYNSRIRRLILKKDYDRAIALLNKAIMYSSKYSDEKQLSYHYGLKAEIYIRYCKYDLALETLDIQLDYAKKCNDTISELKCITQIFSLRSYFINSTELNAKKMLRRVKKLSEITKKTSYYYNSLISIAIYYYKSNNYLEAEKYFKKALSVFTEKTTDAETHVVNMLYLSMIRIHSKNFFGAVILLKKLLRICDDFSVGVYPAFIHNSLGRAYFEQQKHKKSNLHFMKALKLISRDKINDTVLVANTNAYLGLNNLSLKKFKVALSYLKRSVEIYTKHNTTAKDKYIEKRTDFLRSKIQEIKEIGGYF